MTLRTLCNCGSLASVGLWMRIVAIVLCQLASHFAAAQVGRLFPSVDAMVAPASQIYVGSLQAVEITPVTGAPHELRCLATFSISSNLRGEPLKTLSLDFSSTLPAPFMKSLAAQRSKFLLLSHPVENEVTRDLAHKMGSPQSVPQFVWFRLYERDTELYQAGDHMVFAADFRVISNFNDLVREARAALKRNPAIASRLTALYPPNSVARLCGDPNAFAVVTVPVSDFTQGVARRLIEAPRQVVEAAIRKSRRLYHKPKLSNTDLTSLRLTGMRVLSEFPSEENRALMRKMLSVPELQEEAQYSLQKMGG